MNILLRARPFDSYVGVWNFFHWRRDHVFFFFFLFYIAYDSIYHGPEHFSVLAFVRKNSLTLRPPPPPPLTRHHLKIKYSVPNSWVGPHKTLNANYRFYKHPFQLTKLTSISIIYVQVLHFKHYKVLSDSKSTFWKASASWFIAFEFRESIFILYALKQAFSSKRQKKQMQKGV